MRKLINVAKWGATLGTGPQTFLGARWVRSILERSSPEKKRLWALRLLSLSPHYFLDPEDPKYRGMSNDEYLEAAFRSYVDSRKAIYKDILADKLSADDVFLDYGCGPGFLAKVVSENVKRAYALDISPGALECARVLNPSPTLEYVLADESGLTSIPDSGIDVVFSYAVVQHLSDEAYSKMLETCRNKLRAGGKIIIHIQLIDWQWKTEEQWRADRSLQGRLKFKYGLHCFGRTKEVHLEMVNAHGFTKGAITPLSNMLADPDGDLVSQALLTAEKPA